MSDFITAHSANKLTKDKISQNEDLVKIMEEIKEAIENEEFSIQVDKYRVKQSSINYLEQLGYIIRHNSYLPYITISWDFD